ncbi:MAG TPA: RNA methyltransferase [Candidatus Binatia bacterium]|jgi:tRNA G18 (ribose-2'-O)-methylase SpoU|nr:RNA methyltransferase [Candidatus Binatia bacterium]
MPVERVVDADDPRVEPFRDLRDRERGSRDGLFVVETRAVVRELLASRFRSRAILVNDAALASLEPIPPDVPVYVGPMPLLREIVGYNFHRGCLALGERMPDPSLDAILASTPKRLVMLDDVTDPDNVGVIFRTARAFGADGVLLSEGSADPLYRKAIRTSMGATLLVPFARFVEPLDTLSRLRAAGMTLLALTPHDGVDIGTYVPPERAVLLLGTEGAGLRPGVTAAADVALTIPMAAGIDSLNVATAAAIALHALRRVATARHRL